MCRHRTRLLAPLSLIILLALACNFPRAGATPTPMGPELVLTYAAQTVEAQLTLAATGVQPTFTPGAPGVTLFPPTGTTPTAPPPSTPTPTQGVCDKGDFVADVTYPDNSQVAPGAEFVKTWRLKNTGACAWNPSYSVVFEKGDSMGGPASAPLTTGTVAPGQEVDVSVTLKAPDEDGDYQGFWQLRNPSGQVFGLGEKGDKDFWVKIVVGSEAAGTYDFIAQAPSASWVGSGGGGDVNLTFGGDKDNPDGAAWLEDGVRLENGAGAGWTLITIPRRTDDGKISGTFSPFTVQKGNHFTAKLGFLEDCGEGQVVFQLWYKEGDSLNMIEEWGKTCDGNLIYADVDLSDLKGKRLQFVLVVQADGDPQDDQTIWGSAQIVD